MSGRQISGGQKSGGQMSGGQKSAHHHVLPDIIARFVFQEIKAAYLMQREKDIRGVRPKLEYMQLAYFLKFEICLITLKNVILIKIRAHRIKNL